MILGEQKINQWASLCFVRYDDLPSDVRREPVWIWTSGKDDTKPARSPVETPDGQVTAFSREEYVLVAKPSVCGKNNCYLLDRPMEKHLPGQQETRKSQLLYSFHSAQVPKHVRLHLDQTGAFHCTPGKSTLQK
ncbi:uncharacterized protein LJ206_007853 [Theristicus caerulescens]